MKLEQKFQIPAGRTAAWDLLQDIPRVAAAVPGAQLLEVDGDVCRGKAKIKIGPIVMQYDGELHFVKRDADECVMEMTASGRDKRGAGTVEAHVGVSLEETGAEQTTATLSVDMDLTGKPAQFGRSAIEDVTARLIRQFADNLAASTEEPVDGAASGAGGEDPAETEAFDVLGGGAKRQALQTAGGVVVAAASLWLVWRLVRAVKGQRR